MAVCADTKANILATMVDSILLDLERARMTAEDFRQGRGPCTTNGEVVSWRKQLRRVNAVNAVFGLRARYAESEEEMMVETEKFRAHLRDNLDPDVHNAIAEQVSLLSLPPSMLFGPVSALNRMFKEFQAKETPVAVARYLALLCIRQLMEVLPVLETSSFLAAAELLEIFLKLGMPVTTALRTPSAQEAMAKIVLSVVATPGNPPSPIACSRARVVLNLANLLQQSVNSVTGGTRFMYDKSFADVLCEPPRAREARARKN